MALAVGPSVIALSSTDFFSFQNLVFWNLFGFSVPEIHCKNQYLPHSESKSYQINSIKILLIEIFSNNTQGTFQFLSNFQLRFNLICSEKIIQYSRNFCTTRSKHCGTKAHAPLPPHLELFKDTKKNTIRSIPVQ